VRADIGEAAAEPREEEATAALPPAGANPEVAALDGC